MHRTIALLSVLSFLGSDAHAQDFNLDIGHVSGPASSLPTSYSAASGQSGFWNDLTFTPGGLPLTSLSDLSGAATGVTAVSLQFSAPNSAFGCSPPWSTNDTDFYNGISSQQGLTLRISGLEEGEYDVYTYAYDDGPAATRVSFVPGPFANPVIGATCPSPAIHATPDTYITSQVSLPASTDLLINLSAAQPKSNWALSGVQIFRTYGPVGSNYCVSTPTSLGSPSLISATSTRLIPNVTSVSANDLNLTATNVPNQPGWFYYGPNQILVPFVNGFRCVGGTNIGRLPAVFASGGLLNDTVDFTSPPTLATTITPGSTWNFQAYFRDPAAGGGFANLSDGLEIVFGP